MQHLSNADQQESIQSMQSTIRKLENAFSRMTQQGARTTVVNKRLQACTIGLAMLEHVWIQAPHSYTQDEITEARRVLTGLIRSVHSSYVKAKIGSPQRTLLERRRVAFERAIQAMSELDSNMM
ncbi:hypothetical protein [Paenibacillus sp. YYML68]|uniref:hypothetical protein n=1 Tax=Paenibacillus sp. YYML68 TaxID=2909250 RepID=UPI0024930F47|nr:hypothetical protein [Paenibacillus sp. YYML68]